MYFENSYASLRSSFFAYYLTIHTDIFYKYKTIKVLTHIISYLGLLKYDYTHTSKVVCFQKYLIITYLFCFTIMILV